MKNNKGRPTVCKTRRDKIVMFRATKEERLQLALAAKKKGTTVAQVIREGLRKVGVKVEGS